MMGAVIVALIGALYIPGQSRRGRSA
jgi:hypothetical protein